LSKSSRLSDKTISIEVYWKLIDVVGTNRRWTCNPSESPSAIRIYARYVRTAIHTINSCNHSGSTSNTLDIIIENIKARPVVTREFYPIRVSYVFDDFESLSRNIDSFDAVFAGGSQSYSFEHDLISTNYPKRYHGNCYYNFDYRVPLLIKNSFQKVIDRFLHTGVLEIGASVTGSGVGWWWRGRSRRRRSV
jgi:hypothetical protein